MQNANWKEKNFEEKMSVHLDNLYLSIFGDCTLIKRSNRDNFTSGITETLDRHLGIDCVLKTYDGTPISIQEKILKNDNLKYNQLTLEYLNNTYDNPQGDYFHCVSQLYVFAYSNSQNTGLEKYWILNNFNLRFYLYNQIGIEELKRRYLRRNKPPAKASFFAIPFEEIELQPNVIFQKG